MDFMSSGLKPDALERSVTTSDFFATSAVRHSVAAGEGEEAGLVTERVWRKEAQKAQHICLNARRVAVGLRLADALFFRTTERRQKTDAYGLRRDKKGAAGTRFRRLTPTWRR